jgi:hypothetical protein
MKCFRAGLFLLAIASISFSQAPNIFNYQAVIRDANNNLVINQPIGIVISVLHGSAEGTAVYTEIHNPTTNSNGLFTIEIGTGYSNDDFTTIDWANGPYFLRTDTDPDGGFNYTITGISQILSVPYALHAQTVAEEDTSLWTENGIDIYYQSGDVGIGTAAPDEALHVHTSSGESFIRISDTISEENGIKVGLDGTGEGYIINDNSGKELNLGTQGETDVTIDKDGNAVFHKEVRQTKVGTAHLLPVVYGLVYGDGTRNDTYSSNNFTPTRTGPGRYRIDVHGFNKYPFIPFAIAYGSDAKTVNVSIPYVGATGYFDVYCYDTDTGSAVDIIFFFVAFRP